MRHEYNELVTRVLTQQSPNGLLATAANHIAERTDLMRQDQQILDHILKNTYNSGAHDDISGAGLQRKITSYVYRELKTFQAFDSYKSGLTNDMPAQIYNHKMSYLLQSVLNDFTADEGVVVRLFANDFAPEPSFYAHLPTLRTNTYWGSTRGVMYSAKQICAVFATSSIGCADFVDSSIFHSTPCSALPAYLINSGSKFITQLENKSVFSFVHSGYAFGGQRQEAQQYQFGPEDCSSILSNWLSQAQTPSFYRSAANQLSTVHQLYWWRAQQTGHFIIDRLTYNQQIESICNIYYKSAIAQSAQQKWLMPNDVFLLRTFAKANGNPDLNCAGGGHTGIVIDRDPDEPSKVLIFECARDLESENPEAGIWGPAGCGIGSFSANYEQIVDDRIKRTMFLRPRC